MENKYDVASYEIGKELISVKKFVNKFPYIPESTIRWQIHRSKQLGLCSVFIRPFGQRKILIHVEGYFRLMLEKHEEVVSRNG
jgi:hypothetical protein